MKKLRKYLLGLEVKIVVDHQALKWLLNQPDPSGRLARWINTLQEYNYTVTYRKGTSHQNADALSRIPTHLFSTSTAQK